MSFNQFTNLDFADLRAQIKDYLRVNSDFADFDFEGSNFSTLIDLLAYNTYITAYNTNMAVNEAFLDSATLRENGGSLARNSGYVPRSTRSARAVINFSVNMGDNETRIVTLKAGQVALGAQQGGSYIFSIPDDFVATTDETNVAWFNNLNIYEGTYLNYKYTANTTDTDQRFIIPNDNVDTTTLTVKVQESISDSTTNTYTLASGITALDSTSKVYFLQEVENGRFEVYFGDGVLGEAIADGNIVILDYITCNRDEPNGATSFTLSGTVGGFANVTMKDLNDHTSGIATVENVPGYSWTSFDSNIAKHRADFAEAVFTKIPTNTDYRYDYSNLNQTFAASALENISGKSWEVLMQEYIYTPFGMLDAGFGPATVAGVDHPVAYELDMSSEAVSYTHLTLPTKA